MSSSLERLSSGFREAFGRDAEFWVRAPGRVNLIGEHIDYSGYPVLPMALGDSVYALVAARADGRVHLQNLDTQYPAFELDSVDFTIDPNKPAWHKYFLCGLKGAVEALQRSGSNEALAFGMDVLVWGSVAPSAGLSSSSALVCAAVLGTLKRASAKFTTFAPAQVAELAASAERFIGTQGGGMDQAICILAEAGKAMHISFKPLSAVPVPMPATAVFVVAHSGVTANKAATSAFNERVVECRLAAKLLAHIEGKDWRNVATLGELQKVLGKTQEELVALAKSQLHATPYSRAEIQTALGADDAEFGASCLSPNTQGMDSFCLQPRARHVWGEAWRVEEFRRMAEAGSPPTDLGKLMNESHASCRDLYACSCPELDALVSAAIAGGAVGSRLTGAGWGGCSVSLVPAERLEQFKANIKKYFGDQGKPELYEKYVFVSAPASGAEVSEKF